MFGIFDHHRNRPWNRAHRAWGRAVNRTFGPTHPRSIGGKFKTSLKGITSKGGLAGIGIGAAIGYHDEGTWGAIKGGAESAAWEVGLSFAARAAGGIKGIGMLGLGAAAVYGGIAAVDYGNQYIRNRNNMELAGPNIDLFGNVATMRQRSLAMMSQSHLNMRSALGNEAMFVHR